MSSSWRFGGTAEMKRVLIGTRVPTKVHSKKSEPRLELMKFEAGRESEMVK